LIWINLVACGSALAAGARAWRILARRRRLPRREEAEWYAAWQQPGQAGQGSLTRQWIVILAHALAVVVVCVLLLASLNRAAPSPLSTAFESPSAQWVTAMTRFEDPQLNSIGWVAAVLSGFVAGATLGAIGGFGLVTMFGPPVSIGVSADGVQFGALLLPWPHVGSVRLQAERKEILLYSKSRPDTDPATLSPPTRTLFEEVEGKLGELLAVGATTTGLAPWRREQAPSGALFAFILIVAVLVAFAVYPVNAEWVWFFYGLELVALSVAGRFFMSKWSPRLFVEG
jgi:hypothetical protein